MALAAGLSETDSSAREETRTGSWVIGSIGEIVSTDDANPSQGHRLQDLEDLQAFVQSLGIMDGAIVSLLGKKSKAGGLTEEHLTLGDVVVQENHKTVNAVEAGVTKLSEAFRSGDAPRGNDVAASVCREVKAWAAKPKVTSVFEELCLPMGRELGKQSPISYSSTVNSVEEFAGPEDCESSSEMGINLWKGHPSIDSECHYLCRALKHQERVLESRSCGGPGARKPTPRYTPSASKALPMRTNPATKFKTIWPEGLGPRK